MEFCPKCGTILVPAKKGRARRLVCERCGYKTKIKKSIPYKIREKGKEEREVAIIIENKSKKPLEREYELEPPEYYEEIYEA